MFTSQKYSLLIPTFNRPPMLDALLEYLANKEVQFPVFILDSSSNENKTKNREAAKRYHLHVRHLEFEENARFDFKIGSALQEIESDYVSLCADDDIVFINAIEACIGELDRDAELAACHGVYLNFSIGKSEVVLRVEYASPSIDLDDAIRRACQILTQYEALNYAVYRRNVLADVIDAVSRAPQDMFWELFSALVPLVIGKVTRLSVVYYARRANVASGRTEFHPATWIAEDPDAFAKAFLEYRQRLFKYCEASGIDVAPDVRKTLTLAHIIYLCRELHDGRPILQALAGTPSPLATIDLSLKKKPIAQFLAHDAWFRRKIGKIPPLAPGAWLGHKIRQIIGRPDVINFGSYGINFRSSASVRAMLAEEMLIDLSRYIQTPDRL